MLFVLLWCVDMPASYPQQQESSTYIYIHVYMYTHTLHNPKIYFKMIQICNTVLIYVFYLAIENNL